MDLSHIDHLVLTVRDIDRTAQFYQTVLGMQRVSFAGGRTALSFGAQKINLHAAEHPLRPKARHARPGSADLCFIANTSIDRVIDHLNSLAVELEAGPVQRTGAQGPILSVYFRDPDGNLLEVANPL